VVAMHRFSAAARLAVRSSAHTSLARAGNVAPHGLLLRARCLSQAAANAVAEPHSLDSASAAASTEGESAAADATSAVAADVGAASAESTPAATNTVATSFRGGAALHPSTTYRVKMLRAIKERDFELVLNHYDDMVEAGVTPDILTLNCVIEAKAHNQGTVAARDTLQLLLSQHESLQPTAQTYASLMRPCEYDGDVKMAFELYHEALAHKEMPLHVDLFNTLISVCTRARDFAAAENIFEEMREKGVKPKSATYLRYIYACFVRREPEKAYQMLLTMEKDWRVPESKDYVKMLNQFTHANHTEGKALCLKGLVQDMQLSGDNMSVKTLSPNVITGLFREAQERRAPEDVVKLAESLKKANVPMDRFQRVGVFFAHLQLHEPVQAFALAVDHFGDGNKLPAKADDHLVEELAKQASAVDESYFLLESRKAEARPVPLQAVNVIIEACAMMGDLDRAFATWAELEQLELTPDVGTFNALLHTCVRTREVASGRRLISRMAQDTIAPDSTTFMHQAALHIMNRDEGAALKMLETCKEADIVPNARMYMSLINMCVRTRNFERAQALVEDMRNDGHKVRDHVIAKVQGREG